MEGTEQSAARILAVDDDAFSRYLYVGLLSSLGYQVEHATCAADALELLESRPYDVLISDVMMLRTDGIELAHAVRRRAKFADMPVILVTALDDRETRIRGLQVANAILSKPIDKVELALQLKSLLRTRARILGLRRQLDARLALWTAPAGVQVPADPPPPLLSERAVGQGSA